MAFHPYLNFGGNCREAFTRYQGIFGGELFVMGTDELPDAEPAPAGMEGMVMHAALTLGDGQMLMASDTTDHKRPESTYVSYSTPDVAEAERVWKELSDGAEVEMPLGETFWSPAFGVLRDRFGTLWMVGADSPEQQQG